MFSLDGAGTGKREPYEKPVKFLVETVISKQALTQRIL